MITIVSQSNCIIFFNLSATSRIYTLSLHDALPILIGEMPSTIPEKLAYFLGNAGDSHPLDRKSTRLNSSHGYISYAVFCLKKKKMLPSVAIIIQTILLN